MSVVIIHITHKSKYLRNNVRYEKVLNYFRQIRPFKQFNFRFINTLVSKIDLVHPAKPIFRNLFTSHSRNRFAASSFIKN